MVSRSCAGDFSVLVSTFSSDSWRVFDTLSMSDHNNKIVKYDLRVKPLRALFDGKFPRNAKAAAEIQAADKRNDVSWHNKLGYGYIFILSNESILVYKDGLKEIKLFRLTEEIQKLNKEKKGFNLFWILLFAEFYSVSVNGRYFYTHEMSNFHIFKLDWPLSIKSIKFRKAKGIWLTKIYFAPVTNGVFSCGEVRSSSTKLFLGERTFSEGIPELWNFGMTQRLANFPELTGTCRCLSVSEDLVACIMESQVCFFNVLKKEIVACTLFPEGISISGEAEFEEIEVIACSRLYHVLMHYKESTYLLQYAYCVFNSCVFNNIMPEFANEIFTACFSPNGQFLAFRYRETLYVLDRDKFFLYSEDRPEQLEFVDEQHLLCGGYNDCLCLINVKTCDILTCISLGLDNHPWGWPRRVFACRNTVGIIACSSELETFKLIKLWLPQQRKDGNEEQECSCRIHAGNINDPPTSTGIPTSPPTPTEIPTAQHTPPHPD